MRTYGPGCPLVFSHIPKTAGTSLVAVLQEALGPSVSVHGLDSSLLGGYDNLDALSRTARRTMYLTPEDLPVNAALVAGHIAPAMTMCRYPGADHMTVLRIPQVRTISHWLHSRSVSELALRHWGDAAGAFRASWQPLRDYLQHRWVAPLTDNTITRFLTWPHPALSGTAFIDERRDDELLAAALDRLASFRHVNVIENGGFMTEVGAWLGQPLVETRMNVRTSIPPGRRPDLAVELDDATRTLLDHRSRIDIKVWEHVARDVLPDRDLAVLREATIQDAVERYASALADTDAWSPAHPVIERLYELGLRLDPRRRSMGRSTGEASRRQGLRSEPQGLSPVQWPG